MNLFFVLLTIKISIFLNFFLRSWQQIIDLKLDLFIYLFWRGAQTLSAWSGETKKNVPKMDFRIEFLYESLWDAIIIIHCTNAVIMQMILMLD